MIKTDSKHIKELKDVFLYTRITSKIINTGFSAEVSTPFTYKDGTPLEIFIDNDSIVGIGQRNFQRDRLYNNRGKLIIAVGNSNHMEKVIGKYDVVKNIVILYPTERLEQEEIKVLSLLQKHLTKNDITVMIDIDEKQRYRSEIRRKRGDKIQRRLDIVPHVHSWESEDYDD